MISPFPRFRALKFFKKRKADAGTVSAADKSEKK